MRLFRPSMLVFALAVLASLSIHLPVYTVLGELADILIHRSAKSEAAAPTGPVEFELIEQPAQALATAPAEPLPDVKKPDEAEKAKEKDKPKQAKPQTQPKPDRVAAKAEPPKPKPVPVEVVPKPVPMPTEPVPSKHAVTQKSDDPNVPPPDNARFVSEENRRVEEETIASARTTAELDEQPESASRAREAEELPGNAEQEDVQQLQDVRGEDRRNPTAEEAREKPRAPSEVGKGQERAPAVAQAPAQGGSDSKDQQPSRELEAGSPNQGGEPDTLVLNDGTGSIRIRKTPQGAGPGQNGGEARPGASSPAERQAGARKGGGANLNLSFSQFEATFGEAELRAQREAYLEQRKTQARGGRSQEQWKKFRAAVENYVDKVRPGNQTALNAAASPFAAYLAAVHRNIHREFALGFLRSLPLVGGPFADPTLRTRLELVINQDGSLHDLGVVQTSGYTPYDLGAWNAVTKAAPFPEAPKKILSGDGRVYIVWDFYNNERQCGTFNAEPKILKFPQSTPPAAPGPMHDTGDIPRDGKLGSLEHAPHEHFEPPVVTAQQP